MREIKFRGKSVETNKWVYGDLLTIGVATLIYHGPKCDCEVVKDDRIAVGLYHYEVSVVYTDTVGQFTGLHDANGKEIYEGDVVNLCRTFKYDERFGVVTFHQEEVRFAALDISPFMNDENLRVFWRIDKYFIKERKTKVIGNVFDTPELLKGGNQ